VGLPPGVNPSLADPGPGGSADSMAVGSLACGILSVLTSLCCLGLPFGAVGAVLGIIALNRIKTTQQSGKGVAIAGIVLSALGPVLYVLFSLFGAVLGFFPKIFGGP
jgi:hypothetical protein